VLAGIYIELLKICILLGAITCLSVMINDGNWPISRMYHNPVLSKKKFIVIEDNGSRFTASMNETKIIK
jgi:hypothetical protein